jgi:hypothetical protein
MFSTRRLFLAIAMAFAGFGFSSQADAQQIRYFVKQSAGLYEITSQSTGGRFVDAPTGESITVPGVGRFPVVGRTDRAKRGEMVVNQIRGGGPAQVKVTYTPNGRGLATIFSGTIPLPFVLPRMVSLSPDVDNLVVAVMQNGKTTSRRLPTGTRP